MVDAILQELGGQLRLLPARIPGVRGEPGLTEWQGRRFAQSSQSPGGSTPTSTTPGASSSPSWKKLGPGGGVSLPRDLRVPAIEMLPIVDARIYLGLFEERFGIPADTFREYAFFRANVQAIWTVRRDLLLPSRPKPYAVGMPFIITG